MRRSARTLEGQEVSPAAATAALGGMQYWQRKVAAVRGPTPEVLDRAALPVHEWLRAP